MPSGGCEIVGRRPQTAVEIVAKKMKGPREYGALPDFFSCLIAMIKQAGQHGRVLDADGIQRLRFDVKRLQDRRGDL
jgi:hypothetical protein